MKELDKFIIDHGQHLGNNIIKVDSFINHKINPNLMFKCGKELCRRFKSLKPDLILTSEVSGIAPALSVAINIGCEVIYAKKDIPITLGKDFYSSKAMSATKGKIREYVVSKTYLKKGKKVLIIDDFLSSGHTLNALLDIITKANCIPVGVGVLIEKEFENGRENLFYKDIRIESLSKIKEIQENNIILR